MIGEKLKHNIIIVCDLRKKKKNARVAAITHGAVESFTMSPSDRHEGFMSRGRLGINLPMCFDSVAC